MTRMKKVLDWSGASSGGLARIFHKFAETQGVAQISNLLYRGFPTRSAPELSQHSADWKSAIRQVGNLRYEPSARDSPEKFVKSPGQRGGRSGSPQKRQLSV